MCGLRQRALLLREMPEERLGTTQESLRRLQYAGTATQWQNYRCISFPAKSSKPRFIWAQSMEGLQVCADIKGYINTAPSGAMSVSRSLDRDLDYTLRVVYLTYSVLDCRPNNQGLAKLLRTKFKSDVCTKNFMAYDHHANVLVDLDTSDLAPILDGFRHEAKKEAARLIRRLKAIESLAVGVDKDNA
jgi:hypothetical protein